MHIYQILSKNFVHLLLFIKIRLFVDQEVKYPLIQFDFIDLLFQILNLIQFLMKINCYKYYTLMMTTGEMS